jgi:CcmD family protein
MKKTLFILLMLLSLVGKAQNKIEVTAADYSNTSVEMADLMRSEGKIYVLVGIIVLLFLGLLGYMVFTDRKLARLEKEIRRS